MHYVNFGSQYISLRLLFKIFEITDFAILKFLNSELLDFLILIFSVRQSLKSILLDVTARKHIIIMRAREFRTF